MASRTASMQSNNADKGLDEKLMDDYLKANGLYRRKIAKDGSCLFRAVAEQVLNCQGLHTKVRAECVKYLRKNREQYESFIEGDFDEYLQRLQDPQSWVGQVEITALAVLYKRDFIIYQNPGEPPVNITENGYPDKVQLCFLNGNHYDSVYPMSFVKNAAMCQSILYELLYERVCGLDRNVVTGSMKGSRARDEAADVEECKGSEESDLDEDFWSSEATSKATSVNNRPPYKGRGRGQTRGGGRGLLSRQAQDCLNPGIFRNVEYDLWMQSKRAQQRRDFCIAAGMQYTAGDKCQVRLTSTGSYYNAYIQDVGSDDGPVTVFIEELGQKHTVPLWNLRPPSEESWCTVTEKGKRQSVTNGNGHTNEWETRSGRKAARSTSVPYASKATAGSAPNNRVQTQHSWPPQAPEEAQFQGKTATTRKSDQDVGKLGVSPAEEEELLVLELLHKDENNFPSLEASAQAAAAGGEGGRRAEKKGSRKKADVETKDPSQKPEQKADRGKHGKKGSVAQDQRISPPVKEKPTRSPPSTPPSANSPAPLAPKASKVVPAPSLSVQAGPARSQTTPVPSATPPVCTERTSGQSQTVSDASTTTSGSSQTAPVGSRTSAVSHSQTAPVPSAPATATPTPQNTPTQSQSTTSAISAVSTPLASALTPNPSQIGAVPLVAPVSKPGPSQAAQVPTTTTTVPSPIISKPTSVPLTTATSKPGTTPSSTPTTLPTPAHSQTDSVTTIALPQTTSATAHGTEPPPVSSQTAPATSPALATSPAQVPTPTPSHNIPTSSVSDPKMPVQTVPHPAEVPGASSTPPAKVPVPAHTFCEPARAPHSITPPAPVNVSAGPPPQFSSSHAPFHPVGLGTFPMIAHYPPYMTAAPASSPMLNPSPAISAAPTPPFSHPSELRPYEPAASPVAGVGPSAVPDCLPHGLAPPPQHPQHPFPMPPLPHLYQDPLYPGFPQNDKDELIQPPCLSFHRAGKDLPKDINILRFFFNLGVKAFTNPMSPPFNYLAPLTQAYHMQLKVSPPSSNPYTPHWQSDNPPSMLHMSSAPNHPHIGPPVGPGGGAFGHFEVRSVVPAPPPVEAGSFSAHPHSVPMHMPPQPGVPWSVAPSPNLYAGIYSAPPTGRYSGPPCPPQSGPAYPSPSVGHQQFPVPPPQHHGRDIGLVTLAPVIERGEGDGQRSSTPQAEKPIRLAQLHSGGGDKPLAIPVPMEPQRGASASPVVQLVSFGSGPSEEVEASKLANGNKREDNDNTTGFQGRAPAGLISQVQLGSTADEWDLEEAEYGDPDLRSGRSYYSRSFKAGGRRGQEDRGGAGFRGRGSRGRRDYGSRGRPVATEPYFQRGYVRGRGRGYVQHSNTRDAGYTGGQFAPAPET